MTAYRFVTLTCDICGEIFDEGIQVYVCDCRKTAAARGWRTGWGTDRRRIDICWKHQ